MIILIPIPVAAIAAGFLGGYLAEKFVNVVEPALERKLKERAIRKREAKHDNVVTMHKSDVPY